MNRRARTQQELQELLVEQLQFLESSADAYDRGLEGEAKRLAVTVRVLLHDTPNSHSLLGQLNKKGLLFWDTAISNVPDNAIPHGGLVFIALGGSRTKYVAMLDDVPQCRRVPFSEWWNTRVFVDDKKASLSRKDLILTAANQDGGAHVDPSLNETYARLSKGNSMGWVASGPGGPQPVPGPERAAIRQVAHEVIKTLTPGYERKNKHGTSFILGAATVTRGPPLGAVFAEVPKVGRNELCLCGSGRKYKKCHGKRA